MAEESSVNFSIKYMLSMVFLVMASELWNCCETTANLAPIPAIFK